MPGVCHLCWDTGRIGEKGRESMDDFKEDKFAELIRELTKNHGLLT